MITTWMMMMNREDVLLCKNTCMFSGITNNISTRRGNPQGLQAYAVLLAQNRLSVKYIGYWFCKNDYWNVIGYDG